MVRNPNVKAAHFRLSLKREFVLAAGLLMTGAGWAQPDPARSASADGHAIVLTPSSGATSSAPGQPGGWHYMVRSGDTLDRIIALTQAATPFSLAFLRDAFARANPTALPKGAQGPLLAGSLLRIPTSAELRRAAFPELETESPRVAATRESGQGSPVALSAAQREELERRGWVRYP